MRSLAVIEDIPALANQIGRAMKKRRATKFRQGDARLRVRSHRRKSAIDFRAKRVEGIVLRCRYAAANHHDLRIEKRDRGGDRKSLGGKNLLYGGSKRAIAS